MLLLNKITLLGLEEEDEEEEEKKKKIQLLYNLWMLKSCKLVDRT